MQMRHVALGQSHDAHAGESHTLEQSGDIFLVAAQTVHRFGNDDGKSAARGVLDQFLNTGGSSDAPEIARSL